LYYNQTNYLYDNTRVSIYTSEDYERVGPKGGAWFQHITGKSFEAVKGLKRCEYIYIIKMFKGMTYTTIDKTVVKPMSIPEPLSPNVITEMSKEDFGQLLHNDSVNIVIKFGAEWCGPCKRVDPLVHQWMNKLPPSIQGVMIDIDDNFELYAFLKSKKLINGVPTIMYYKKENKTVIPDGVVVGADESQINTFFTKILSYA